MDSIETAIKAFKLGSFVIVIDDPERENEGDLILAAEHATPEKIGFMIRHTSGVICVPLLETRLEELGIPMMVSANTESQRTAFTVSVDYDPKTTTGISSSDRSHTIHALISPNAKPQEFNKPGHIFPLKYREGGVLKRAGHTEATIDFTNLAGCYPAGVLAEIVNDDGSIKKLSDLKLFAKEHNLPIVSVAGLIRYRRKKEKLVTAVSTAKLPTEHGEFTVHVYRSKLDGIEHLALVKGDVQKDTLVRVHSECLTGDVFSSNRCDCGAQLTLAMQKIASEGHGVIVYLRGHEGRGIGLGHKVHAYHLQDKGCDTVEANEQLGLPIDSREYGIGAQILSDLGVTTVRLLTNNPAKYGGLEGYDLKITERIPLIPAVAPEAIPYLRTKQEKLGHLLNMSLETTPLK